MTAFESKIQALMDEVYDEWRKEENGRKSKWDVLNRFSAAHQIAVVFGNFNNQVENGGLEQWIYNEYFHNDAEKLTEYLEIGKEFDERCHTILDRVYKLNQYAKETACDRFGNYRDPDDEDGENSFIGDMIDCGAFDTWYYERCDKDDWWEIVCRIIDKVEGREFMSDRQDEQGNEKRYPPLQVYIENVHDERIGGFTMPLPATLEEMQPFLEGAEITGWWDMKICEVYLKIPDVGESSFDPDKKAMTPDTFNELNYLAARLRDLDGDGRDIFSVAYMAGKNCESLREMINLTFSENLNCFGLLPAFSNEQYGDFLIEQVGIDVHADAFNRLEKSGEPGDKELAEYIEKLEKYVDRDAYGRDAIKEENGVLTDKGLLMGGDGIQEIYRGPEDIPAEHRIFIDENVRTLVKAENVDVVATLMAIYAVCGDDMTGGAAYKLNPLIEGKERDYILMVNESLTDLSPAIDAYKRGSYLSDTISKWSKNPKARIFSVKITKRDEEGITGDFVELNFKSLVSNITRHSISPDRIIATMTDGSKRSFDLWDWADLPIPYRSSIIGSEQHYSESDIQKVQSHFNTYRNEYAKECEKVGVFHIFDILNAAYMKAAENPNQNMLRITNETTKQILARGEAEVFRLTPAGAEKLAPIEAARPLCFAEHRELAIKREDVGSLDKWAKRAAQSLFRQNEREKRDKSQTKGKEL